MNDHPHDSPEPAPARSPQQPQVVYAEPPAERKRGGWFFGLRAGVLLFLALMLFYLGFLFALNQFGGEGPIVSTFREGEGNRKIAVIPIRGLITSDTSEFARDVVRSILDDENIGAVVLRVESPGGGATASDEIHHQLRRLREERGLPIIASYGDYAASGGYYVSAFADRIYAQPTTLTGSIGVIAPYFTIHEMLDNIGVDPQIMTSTAATDKDTGSMFRPWTEEDREAIREILNAIQERFVTVVAEGRQAVLTAEEVRSVATGQALMAEEALDLKLIDEIGYLDAALEHAREMGGFTEEEPPVVMYGRRGGLGSLIGLSSSDGEAGGGVSGPLRLDAESVRRWLSEMSVPRMMYLFQP